MHSVDNGQELPQEDTAQAVHQSVSQHTRTPNPASQPAKPRLNGIYAWWFAADTTSALSNSIRSFAISTVLLILTGSTAQAGKLNALSSLLIGMTSFIGGVIIDRFDRRVLLILSSAIGTAIYSAVSLWGGLWGLNTVVLYIMAILLAIKSGLLGTVSNVFLRSVVPAEELPTAMSLNEGRDATINLLGSPLSGLLVTVSSIFPFITAAVLNGTATLCAFFIRPGKKSVNGKTEIWSGKGKSQKTKIPAADTVKGAKDAKGGKDGKKTVYSVLREELLNSLKGLILIARTPVLRFIVILSALYFPLLNGIMSLLIFYTINSQKSPLSAGFLESAAAAGMLAGSLVSATIVKHFAAGKVAVTAFLVPIPFALGAVLAPNYIMRFCFLIPVVLMLPAANASIGGFTMYFIPKELLGRYFAVLTLLGVILNPIVSLYVGYGLALYGLTATGIVLVMLMATVSMASWNRTIRTIPKPDKWKEYAASITVQV